MKVLESGRKLEYTVSCNHYADNGKSYGQEDAE